LNGVSQGIKSKPADSYHVYWRIKFVPGTIKAVSRKNGIQASSAERKLPVNQLKLF
jgi:beta-galactosidase